MSDDELIPLEKIQDMLDDNEAYIKNFCKAGITSFTKFRDNYIEAMRNNELRLLRDEGHRVKPVIQMLGFDTIQKEYEHAKDLLQSDAPDERIKASIDKMRKQCDAIIEGFKKEARKLETD